MAGCALFLVGRSNFVTGEVLYADGGWRAYGWGAGDQYRPDPVGVPGFALSSESQNEYPDKPLLGVTNV